MLAGLRSRWTIPESCANCSAAQSGRHDAPHVVDRQPAVRANLVLQARAVEQLHHQERVLGLIDVEIEDRDDVRVAEPGAGPALAHESLAGRVAGLVGADDLDGHLVAEQRAAGAVDRAHPAFGERREYLVPAVEDLSGGVHLRQLWPKAGRRRRHLLLTVRPWFSRRK